MQVSFTLLTQPLVLATGSVEQKNLINEKNAVTVDC